MCARGIVYCDGARVRVRMRVPACLRACACACYCVIVKGAARCAHVLSMDQASAETRRPIQLTHTRHPGERPAHTNYLWLVMAKICYDTISAVGRICTWLGCARDTVPGNIWFC